MPLTSSSVFLNRYALPFVWHIVHHGKQIPRAIRPFSGSLFERGNKLLPNDCRPVP